MPSDSHSFDLLVIGGGVAGVAVAWHALQAGMAVGLVERHVVAAHASGRNDGQVLLGLGEHFHRLVGQWGVDDALLLWRFFADNQAAMRDVIAAEAIDCDFVQGGGLRLAATPHEQLELAESAALLAAHGLAHELLNVSELARRLPLAVGFHGALALPGEAIFEPRAFVVGLAERAQRRGLWLCERADAIAVLGEMGDFVVRLADGRELRAHAVVHASSALGLDLDRSGFLAGRVFPFRAQMLETAEMAPELAAQMPPYAMSTNFCYEYWRMRGRRLSLGGLRWSVRGEELGITDDDELHPEIARGLRAWLAEHFPALATLAIERDWTGILAGTPDGLPLIGEIPGRSGELATLAFNGYGMSFAFLAGREIAAMLTEGRHLHPATRLFLPRRFRA